jgi:hypothetical protein
MHHMHFTIVGDAVGEFPALATVTHADAGTVQAYREVMAKTVAFLQAALTDPPRTRRK